MNAAIKVGFKALHWNERRVSYFITDDARLTRAIMLLDRDEQKRRIEAAGKVPFGSYNQTDFVKSRAMVEIQFGKYAFVAHDLFVKHMAFFTTDHMDVGIEVLPMKSLQAQMSSGVPYYEGALFDLIRQGRGYRTFRLCSSAWSRTSRSIQLCLQPRLRKRPPRSTLARSPGKSADTSALRRVHAAKPRAPV